jgi:hypothetical protein
MKYLIAGLVTLIPVIRALHCVHLLLFKYQLSLFRIICKVLFCVLTVIAGICRKKDLTSTVFQFLVSAQSSFRIGDLNSCPSDLELGALTKWLASRSYYDCLGRIFYRFHLQYALSTNPHLCCSAKVSPRLKSET